MLHSRENGIVQELNVVELCILIPTYSLHEQKLRAHLILICTRFNIFYKMKIDNGQEVIYSCMNSSTELEEHSPIAREEEQQLYNVVAATKR